MKNLKHFCFLFVLLTLVSCGKEEKKTTKNYSLSGLRSDGIVFVELAQSAPGTLAIVCVDSGSTLGTKVSSLRSFRSTIDPNSSSSISYTVGSTTISPSAMANMLADAIAVLQIGNQASSACPQQILSTSH